MEIYNTDTKETETISYSLNGCDCSQDIALDSDQIKYNEEEERYEASDEEIRYWKDWFNETIQADDMENDLKELIREKHRQGYYESLDWVRNKIDEINQECGWSEFSEVPKERQKLYKELYTEVKEWWNSKNDVDPIEGYWRLED
jgi:hypothetical protein